MEIRIGFTITPGPEGWQFPPVQFLKIYKTEGSENLDSLKNDLQDIMNYAEQKLASYKAPDKEAALISALQAIAKTQAKLTKD